MDTEQVIDRAGAVHLGDLRVPVISIEDLIANKRVAARPQDLADMALLEKVAGRR